MTFIFTFSFKPETQEAVYAGNVNLQQALQLLQQIVIVDTAKKLREQERQAEQNTPKVEQTMPESDMNVPNEGAK